MAGLLLLWGTTIWGILYKSISTHVNSKLSLIVYLVMGWVGIIFLPVIIRTSWLFILFIILVIYFIYRIRWSSYTIGHGLCTKNRPYFHMIWHIFYRYCITLSFYRIVYFM